MKTFAITALLSGLTLYLVLRWHFAPPALPEREGGYYLFCSFQGNGADGLHLAWSDDGLRWEAINNGESVLCPHVGGGLMRDPCICRGPDGTWHMVWTDSWAGHSIGYAHSPDLVHWSAQRALPVMSDEPTARNCWAPELVYDAQDRHFLLIWSSTIPGRFPGTDGNSEDGHDHRIYSTITSDFGEFSPTRLFFDPRHNVIDATLLQDNGQWLLFYKDETLKPHPQKHILMAASESAQGPFRPSSRPISRDWVEGPTAVRIGEYLYLYFDCYRDGKFAALRSRDLATWEDISDRLSLPAGTRHGTICAGDRATLQRLLQAHAFPTRPRLRVIAGAVLACTLASVVLSRWGGTRSQRWRRAALPPLWGLGVVTLGYALAWVEAWTRSL